MVFVAASSWDYAVFFTGGIVVLLFLAGVSRGIVSYPLLSQARSLCAAARRKMLSRQTDDEIGLIVQTRMLSQKVQNFRVICRVLSTFGCLAVFPIMLNIALGDHRTFHPVQDLAFVLSFGTVTIVLVFPWVLSSPKTMNAIYIDLMLCVLAYVCPAIPSENVMELVWSANVVVFALTLTRRCVVLTSIMNFLFMVTTCATIMVHAGDYDSVVRPNVLMFIQVTVILLMSVCAQSIETSIVTAVRQGLENEATKELLAAASALLRSCHDIVVELDTQGTIVGHADTLESFLLRGSAGDLVGSKLSDLMPHEEDRASFSEMLRKQQMSDSDLAEATHVRMQDGNGNTLRLEVMSFRFRHVDLRLRYMVGLREFTDFSASAPGRAPGVEQSPYAGRAPLALPEEMTVVTGSEEEAVAILVLDCSRSHYPVRGCSAGFRMRIGHLALGTSFLALVRNSPDFVCWLQHALNLDYQNVDAEEYSVILNMPQGGIKARCRLLPEYMPEDGGSPEDEGAAEAEDDLERVRLQFTRMRRCPQRL